MVYKKYNVLAAILEYIRLNCANCNYDELIDPKNDCIKAMSFELKIFPSIICQYIRRNLDEVIPILNNCSQRENIDQILQIEEKKILTTSTPEKSIDISKTLILDVTNISPIRDTVLSYENGNEEIDYKDVTVNTLELSSDLHLSDPVVNELLPHGSINRIRRNEVQLSYKNCVNLEGKFNIPDNHREYLFEDCKSKEYFNYYLRNRIHKYVNNTCSLAMKSKKFLLNGDILITAYCVHNERNCKKFKIHVVSRRFVNVYSSSRDFYHEKLITTYVKGHERLKAKKKLLLSKPLEYKKKTLLRANVKLINHGNLQDIKSDPTIRKIRSEAKRQLDRDVDDWRDICKMQLCNGEYIQEVSIPFMVKLFSREQLQVLKYEKNIKPSPFFLHFDATGSIIRKPYEECKRIYLYSGVIQTSNGRIFPVMELISGTHYTRDLRKFFGDFKYFATQHSNWPTFSGVVTDFCLASLNALSQEFCGMQLIEYINFCYNNFYVVTSKPRENMISLHLCCAHFVKMFCKDIEQTVGQVNIQNQLKDLMACCMTLQEFNQIEGWMKHVFILLCHPSDNPIVKNSFQHLLLIAAGEEHSIPKVYNHQLKSTEMSSVQDLPNYSLAKQSLFYKHFDKVRYNIDEDVLNDATNSYYNPKLYDLIMKKYIPYLPLWSAIMLKRFDRNRVSNAPVENYFNTMKHRILRGERNWKCSRFVRATRETVLALYKEMLCVIPKSNLTGRFHRQDKVMWNRRRPVYKGHFEGRHLRNMIKKQINQKHDETTTPICQYCAEGSLETTATDWVQCDACTMWVHQNCEPDKTFTGEFICKFCKAAQTEEIHDEITEEVSFKINRVNFLDNGLMKDYTYYKKFSNGRGYIVAILDHPRRKLPLSDYLTLNGENWLSDSIMDFILNMMNKSGVYQIIDAGLQAQFIFNEPSHIFLKNFKIHKKNLFIPLIVNGNHWCAVEINISKREFTYLDPFGEELSTSISYLKKFITYLEKSDQLNELQNVHCWKMISKKHIEQRDAYNCGIFILYFFKQLIKNKSLDEYADMNELRKQYQKDVLISSMSLKNTCLICGTTRDESYRRCKYCVRIFHERCMFENLIKNDMCDLCFQYK